MWGDGNRLKTADIWYLSCRQMLGRRASPQGVAGGACPTLSPTNRQNLMTKKTCDIIIPSFQGRSTDSCYVNKGYGHHDFIDIRIAYMNNYKICHTGKKVQVLKGLIFCMQSQCILVSDHVWFSAQSSRILKYSILFLIHFTSVSFLNFLYRFIHKLSNPFKNLFRLLSTPGIGLDLK